MTLGPIATNTFSTAHWVSGYPYPVLKALPYVLVTAAGSQIYGASSPGINLVSVTDQNGNDATALANTSAVSWLTTTSSTSNVGSYVIGGTEATVNAGYQLTYIGAVTVTARPLAVTADDLSRVYGDANPNLTYSITSGNLVNGDALSGGLATSATTASNVGGYAIAQGTLGNSNYAISYTPGTLTVTARPLTITADDLSRVYGDANPNLTYSITSGNLVNGDSLPGGLATSATTASNVGGYSITQGSLAAGSNYSVTYTAGTLSITARPLTITADDLSRLYGDANPALTYTVGGGGLINGDTLSGGLTTTASTTSNVGGYGIVQGTLAASSNYDITGFTAGTLSVTARPITVTADDLSRLYGDANPSLTYTVGGGGLVNGDTLSGGLATSATTTSNVGGYAITQGTLAASSNYSVTYTAGTFSITARPITVSADDQSRVYGDANPVLTYSITSGNLVGADELTGALATIAGSASAVGNYAITRNTLTAGNNYALNYQGANLVVTPRSLIVTADAQSRIYGDANPVSGGAAGNNLVNGDTISGVTLSSLATVASNVGAYDLTGSAAVFGSGSASNYAIGYATRSGGLNVTPRSLIVTADAQSRIYGDANPVSGGAAGNNLVNGDTISGVTLSSLATVASNVGVYDLTGSAAVFGSGSASNYAVSYATRSGGLSVTPRSLIVTADAQSRIYGDANPVSGGAAGNNLVNGDTISGVTLSSLATVASNVGAYDLTGSAAVFGSGSASNYAISYATRSGGLNVTPRSLIVTADTQSRIYGDANPSLTYTVGGGGLVNGDTLSGGLATSATTTSNVGGYSITQGNLAAGSNYSATYTAGTLSITVRPITVTADNLSRLYGDANPSLSYTVGGGGLVNGDTLSGGLATSATTTSNVGGYAITQGTLAVSSNYSVTYTAGTLSITARPVTVTGGTIGRTYGDNNPTTTTAFSAPTGAAGTGLGLVNGDSIGNVTVTSSADNMSNVGGYSFTPGGASFSSGLASNYAITYANGTLNVTARPVTVTGGTIGRTYGDNNPTTTTAFSAPTGAAGTGLGLVNGDSIGNVTVTSSADNMSNVGGYSFTPGGASFSSGLASNYAITYANGTLNVTARTLTIAAVTDTKTYDSTTSSIGVPVAGSGLVNGDSISGFTQAFQSPNVLGTNASILAVNAGSGTVADGNGGNNYALVYQTTTGTIMPAALTVTANNLTKVYGTNLTFAGWEFATSGLVGGDTVTSATLASAGSPGTATVAGGPFTTIVSGAQGSGLGNYTISYVNGTMTVTPAPLTIVADDKTRVVNAPNPALTATYIGLVNGEDTSVVSGLLLSTLANAVSPVGDYAITASGAQAANYTITQVAGVLAVTTTTPASPTSQTNPPSLPPPNPGVNITFQPPANGPVSVSFTQPVSVANNPPPADDTNIVTAAIPDESKLAVNNGLTFQPISQFDPNQYTQFILPAYAGQAGEAAIFAMIARAEDQEDAADYLINTFWNGAAGAWNSAVATLAGKVTFSNGAGNTFDPSGNAGFPIVPGSTDFGQMLKNGPVMIGDGGQPAHWLLATQMTADGDGIVANDPAIGKQVVLTYDAITKTVGGVTGIFDAKTKGFVSLAAAGGDLPVGSGGAAGLQGFVRRRSSQSSSDKRRNFG